MAVLALGAMPLFTSCSNNEEDDVNNVPSAYDFAEPAFAKHAKRLEIKDTNSPYASIEFTESGNYVITLNYAAPQNAPARVGTHRASRLLAMSGVATKTRAQAYDEENSIIHGHYTMEGDNVYILKNFGTVVVEKQKDQVASIVVTPHGEDSYVLTASIAKTMQDSEMTRAICRTWEFEKMRVVLDANGIKIDKTYPWTKEGAKACKKDLEPFKYIVYSSDDDYSERIYDVLYYYLIEDFEDGTQPSQVICSKSGSYMVIYADQSLALSTWGWDKYEPGLMRYSWDYDSLYDPDNSGVVQVSFEDKYLLVKEDIWDSEVTEEEISGVGYVVYYGKDVK